MRRTMSVEIEAPPDVVFRLARGVERWERLLPHYARSRVVERRADEARVVEFVARALSTSFGFGGLNAALVLGATKR